MCLSKSSSVNLAEGILIHGVLNFTIKSTESLSQGEANQGILTSLQNLSISVNSSIPNSILFYNQNKLYFPMAFRE